jgi:hypothetical protein
MRPESIATPLLIALDTSIGCESERYLIMLVL